MATATAALASARRSALTVHRTIPSIRAVRNALPPSLSVGYVPTMGALHDGHLSLVKEARSKNDVVVASIFVNPTQFRAGEDLDKYPRQFEQDADLLADLGVDHLFAPDNDTMYGRNHVTFVDPTSFDKTSEGSSRPGHFRGVATVVTKLFNIVKPTNAYFGQKDAAQCVLIRRIVEDLNMDVSVNVQNTVREDNGLAMSSRNAYLSREERKAAPIVFKSLCAAKDLFLEAAATGTLPVPAKALSTAVREVLGTEPLVSEIQYVSVDDRETMQPLTEVVSKGAIISLACQVGSVRLIDNIMI
eukprot:CAMPEP_0197436052 /NCGR_PEP_ID=MMETSP1175-20131217/3524_1 /TAXON_ID=1003142 /ORGANISM="Triceratium dubium, Strain CCMP147" /LENGTH=301 /DNA_ID=CAMNT_0042965233 /DNA_START=135 /DNA_END=1040 /DNA_ORIENTATION=+